MTPHWPQGTTKVIIAPLNWGLGHATRSIPIIRALLKANIEVIIASDGEALALLQEEFPQLHFETLAPYGVKYTRETLWGILLTNGPNVGKAIIKEYRQTQALVRKHKPDLLISDSRFGFRSSIVTSVVITHQLHLLSSSADFDSAQSAAQSTVQSTTKSTAKSAARAANTLLLALLNIANTALLNRFSECWIPDTNTHKWSGQLSQSTKVKKQKFIGPLSRLNPIAPLPTILYDKAIILSGPEPARSKLEAQLLSQLKDSHETICLVRGTALLPDLKTLPPNWTVIKRANSKEINTILLSSRHIISRSGYTSIMDYAALGLSATLIPTPGQPEQEYLARYLDGKEGFRKG